ncbi:MAG: hypothetical protein AAGA31_10880, partial [Bacteroidota bacterium]
MISVKRLLLLPLLLSLCFPFSLLAQCGLEPTGEIVGGGRTISSQTELDNFVSLAGEKFTTINNRLLLVGGGTDPIVDLCNLSALETINGALQFEGFGPENSLRVYLPNLKEAKRLKLGDLLGGGNPGLLSFSAPKLERINGILTISGNPELEFFHFPELQYLGDPEVEQTTALVLQDNHKLITAIFPKVQAILGSINILDEHPALTQVQISGELPKVSFSGWLKMEGVFPALKAVSFPELVLVSSHISLDGITAQTAAIVTFPELARVGGSIEISSFARNLSFGSDRLRVNKNFRVDKNHNLERLTMANTTVRENFLVDDNEAAFLIDARLVEVGGSLRIAASEPYPVGISLPALRKVGGSAFLLNAGAGSVSIGDELEILGSLRVQAGPYVETLSIDVETIGQDFSVIGNGPEGANSALKNISVPKLREVKGDFSIGRLPNFQGFKGGSDFGQLRSIGSGASKLEIFENPLVEECCLFSCQVSLNGEVVSRGNPNVRIFGNAGSCKSFGTLLSACPQNPATSFTRTTIRHRRSNYLAYTADNTIGVTAFDWQVFYNDRLVYTGTRSSLYTPPR